MTPTPIGICTYCGCPLHAPHATLIDPYDNVSHFCENCWAEREAWSPPVDTLALSIGGGPWD